MVSSQQANTVDQSMRLRMDEPEDALDAEPVVEVGAGDDAGLVVEVVDAGLGSQAVSVVVASMEVDDVVVVDVDAEVDTD